MLIEMAVADAYGVAWEFTDAQKGANDLTAYRQHPTYAELTPGRYTDDTQRAVANARVVLAGEQAWYDPAAYARAYTDVFQEDPREGWSRRFQAYLRDNAGGPAAGFLRGIRRRSTNGALMGVAPLGFLPSADAVRLATTMQVVSTHSGSAVPYAQMVSLSTFYLLHGIGPRSKLVDYLSDEVEWPTEDECGSDERKRMVHAMRFDPPTALMPARTVAPAAVWAATGLNSLSSIIRWAVRHGRDTDSLAATAVAIASCSEEVENDLPAALIDGLEDEAGRDRLSAIDDALRVLLAGTRT